MFTQEELKKMFNNGGINTKIENDTNSVDAYLNKLKTYSNTKTELQDTITNTSSGDTINKPLKYITPDEWHKFTNYTVDEIAQAIKTKESKWDYNAKWWSTEIGAYQFMPTTWSSWVEEFNNDKSVNSDINGTYDKQLMEIDKTGKLKMTPENQDAITKWKIQNLLDDWYNALQIASIWNSGEPDWTWKIWTNKYGVKYNTPEYVTRIASLLPVKDEIVDKALDTTKINTQKLEGDVDNVEKEITPWIDYIPSDNILKNTWLSFVQQFKDFGDIFTNPKQTIKSFSTLWNTIVDYLNGNWVSEQSQAIKDGLLNYYKERYGGIDNLKRTISQDPFGFASDASMVLSIIAAPFTWWASLLANLGVQGKTVASVLKTAKVIDNVADIIDPVTLTFKGIKKWTKFVNKLAKTDVTKTLWTLEDVVSDKYTNAFKIKDNTLLSKKLTNNYLDLIKDWYVGTIDNIRKQADKNLDVAKNVYNSNNLKGKLNLVLNNKKLESLYNIIESKIDDMLDDSGNVKSWMESQYKTMQDMYDNIKSSKNPTYWTLNEYKQQWADMVYGKKWEKTPVFPSGSEYNAAQARLEMADILNDFLTDNVSELADANKKWNNALTAKALADSTATYMEKITESQKRQKGYLVPTILWGIGTGVATQNPLAALWTAWVVFIWANAFEYFKKVVGNATKGTMSAKNYNNIVQFFDKYFTPTMADRFKDLKTWDEQIKFINWVVQDTRRVVTKQSKAEENNFMNQKNQSIKPPVNSKWLFGSVQNEKVDLFKSVK